MKGMPKLWKALALPRSFAKPPGGGEGSGIAGRPPQGGPLDPSLPGKDDPQ